MCSKSAGIIYFRIKTLIVNCLQPQKGTTSTDGRVSSTEHVDGPTNVRKDKRTDGQTDETMTATNAIGNDIDQLGPIKKLGVNSTCYWPIGPR